MAICFSLGAVTVAQLTHPNRAPVQLQIFVQDVITHTCTLESDDILLAHSLCEMRLKNVGRKQCS